MQVALTRKLAKAMGVTPGPAKPENPLFEWTATWAKAWEANFTQDDMIVLVNSATRFVVAIYQVKKADMAKADGKMLQDAIRATLMSSLNMKADFADAYIEAAGVVSFCTNTNMQHSSWLTGAIFHCSSLVSEKYRIYNLCYAEPDVFDNTIGTRFNSGYADLPKGHLIVPREVMTQKLTDLLGEAARHYRAFEVIFTLDLGAYKLTRQLLLHEYIGFGELHNALQRVLGWEGYLPHSFTVQDKGKIALAISNSGGENTLDENGHALSEFFPKSKRIVYSYGSWEAEILLVRTIQDQSGESPYLLAASGQAPPEGLGGVKEFLEFREIMLDPGHGRHQEAKRRFGNWDPNLSFFQSKPGAVWAVWREWKGR